MLGLSLRTSDIRDLFKALLNTKQFTTVNREGSMTDLVGNSTIEICGASFIADEDSIFGEVNWDYVKREEEWYNSMSLNVNDIPGGTPQIWKAVADKDGFINSNYGWCIYSNENFSPRKSAAPLVVPSEDVQFDDGFPIASCQYLAALQELKKNPESRRAIMIYTRPSMWLDYNKNGRSDFMCTNAVQYLIRNGSLNAVVQMRSNDAVFGYKNDRAWQHHVLSKLAAELELPVGDIIWQVGSLHVYARHYHLVDPVNYPKQA
jgi:thymidylate synthase